MSRNGLSTGFAHWHTYMGRHRRRGSRCRIGCGQPGSHQGQQPWHCVSKDVLLPCGTVRYVPRSRGQASSEPLCLQWIGVLFAPLLREEWNGACR
eukprot:297470-Pelagomonas_calceolata.AAC.3